MNAQFQVLPNYIQMLLRVITATGLAACFVFTIGMVWSASLWPDSIAQAVIYAFGAAIALGAIFGRVSLQSSWLLLPFAVLPTWALLQLHLGISAYRFGTWQSLLAFGSVAVAAGLALFSFELAQIRRAFQPAMVTLGATLSVFTLLQFVFTPGRIYFVIESPWPGHIMGPFVNRDQYSALIELLLPVAVWSVAQRPHTVIYGAITALMYASVVAGASRAGVVITTIEVIAVLVLASRRQKTGRLHFLSRRVVPLAVLLVILSAAVGWTVVLGRLTDKNPFLYRKDFWTASLSMVRDRPLFGSGIGSWQWIYPRYATVDAGAIVRHAHNDWLEWTCDGGLILFTAFLSIAVYSLWLGWAYPWAMGPAMVFAHSLVDFPLHTYPILLGLALFLTAAESCRLQEHLVRAPAEHSALSQTTA